MDENQINVNDFIDVSAIIKQLDINNAKELLKENGYFIDNLWRTCDITDIWDCTDEQAQELLYKALTSESTIEQIHIAVCFMAEDMNLKELS
jgi:hypothetical protein